MRRRLPLSSGKQVVCLRLPGNKYPTYSLLPHKSYHSALSRFVVVLERPLVPDSLGVVSTSQVQVRVGASAIV